MTIMKQGETIAEILVERLNASAGQIAVWDPVADDASFVAKNWHQLADAVLNRALVFSAHEIGPGDHVAHLAENSSQWLITDLALQFVGAVHIPLHSLSTSHQINELLRHCSPVALITSNFMQASKAADFLNDHRQTDVFCYFPCDDPVHKIPVDPVRYLDAWSAPMVRDVVELSNRFEQLLATNNVTADRLLSILYTSGTTGQCKGVMLTQRNVVANVRSKLSVLPLHSSDIRLCLLPLSHIFARTCDFYTWIRSGSQLAISRGRDHWFHELKTIRPTYINAVPYFYEKCWRILRDQGLLDQQHALPDLLGNRVRIANCGGAAIPNDVFDYFHDQGVCLITGYGLTETSPVLSSSSPTKLRKGAVGLAVPGVELRIADDGEIMARGENVTPGYFKDPEMTAAAIRDGWFYTGDLGTIDEDGFLQITGRKKEMIVTNVGKNISPVLIESCLNRIPMVKQSMVVGDGRDFLVGLLVVNPEQIAKELGGSIDVDFEKYEIDEELESLLRKQIDLELIDLSQSEQVGAFCLTDKPFSITNGMLTSKSSLRRTVIAQAFGEKLDQAYRCQRQHGLAKDR